MAYKKKEGASSAFLFICIALCALSFLASLPAIAAAPAGSPGSYVVINSRDWHDLYIATVYAGLLNETIISFNNLGEAQLKSKIIAAGSDVVVIEPRKNPVVKNYGAYLSANGVTPATIINYDTYIDLQSSLLSRYSADTARPRSADISAYAIFYAKYGVEAVDMAPRMYTQSLWPLFVDEDTAQQFFATTRSMPQKNAIVSGHMPVRILAGIEQVWNISERYTSFEENNSLSIEKRVTSLHPGKIGILMQIDRIDLQSVIQALPQFAYYGSQPDIGAQLANSNVQILEIIGTGAADLARPIGQLSGKNLKFLVKYARGFSNIPGLEGQLLDIDTVTFPHESVEVTLDKAVYHPQEHTLAITITNHGTASALTYSTIEFGSSTVADQVTQLIPPKTAITIPYKLDADITPANTTTISTLYGKYAPLKESVLSAKGEPIVILPVQEESADDTANITFVSSEVDDQAGLLTVTVKNNAGSPALVTAQLSRADQALAASQPTSIGSQTQGGLVIPVPYLAKDDILNNAFNLTLYYGQTQTIKLQSQNVTVTKVTQHGLPTGTLVLVGLGLLVIIALITIFVRRLRKR